ncbi:uncharacterized protein LOC129592087 [Paramacrobiotus metropolitanus]|uniref:uncharacterized protein LOC129592087 n=1 Tax=Paramacrobiotus metropolitanus TaxID=2943436 RepID=UPI0024463CBB|nr:uncharacterized protein LOC129592087 [Paramacrobiotus metropolitanus]XP_055344023.1 uncharacterized protein LOC129592087 [Paramacrobiotus metropolitanus]XP_055344025.1 uncharacterized protein LOC129592087 [Paramacrobiotus metropolitanus]XP_055344026.1 uncharacterized protein LOC129592087 [Paramacrobiotus metropolitanus]XP_055344027.1 uncharacterized protein LOC129592087 [Paramacrobiotus metropolitanus]
MLETMPPYQALLADANQMNYHNSVAVRMPDDTWLLGYIQDIDGNHAFIHFSSTTFEARWMHMQNVWPLPSYWESELPVERRIFAALRDEVDGPFRFRPAVLLQTLDGYQMFCIETDISEADASAHKAGFELVHLRQVASALPPTGPCLLECRSGLLYTKYFIPFGQARIVLSEPADKFRIIKHVYDAIEAKLKSGRENLPDCCRFHLRIQSEGCLFVFVSLPTDAQQTQWMEEILPKILETHLTSRPYLLPVDNLAFPAHENIPREADLDVDALMLTACIQDLTLSLLSDILSHLDLHSQMKAKRACALWHLLLSNPRMMEHVSISFESCWQLKADGAKCFLKRDSDNCFKAASLLSRCINSTTVSLTLLKVFPPDHAALLYPMLRTMKITLPLLVLKDHINVKPVGLSQQKQSRLKHGAAIDLTLYKHTCNSVLLHNWKISDLFGRQMYDVFVSNFYYERHSGVGAIPCRLPAHEREWMVSLTRHAHELAIDKLQITIPKLHIHCSEGRFHMTRRLMRALDDNFPPVTQDMLAKVGAVRARWIRTLSYPDDWQSIRNYLLLFSGFHSDGTPKVWDEVDLRCVHLSTWSKMAIYGINEVFRV